MTTIDHTTREANTTTRSTAPYILAVTSHRPEEIVRSLAGVPAEIITIDATQSKHRRALNTYRKTKASIRDHEPDLILLDCYEISGLAVALLARRYEIPLIARLVGDTWRGYEQTTVKSIESAADLVRFVEHRASVYINNVVFDTATGYVAVSEELREIIHDRTGCPRDRIGVVPVPLTLDTKAVGVADCARQSLGIDEQQVVLTVTNLTFEAKYRGIQTILADIEPLLAENPECAYVIAGDGRYYKQLQETIAETIDDPAIRERIYTPGYVDDVAHLYALADAFAYVSYRDGYPNAVLEAQTAALPVVANDAHGMRDQITDGETGYLVDPEADGELRARLSKLLASPTHRELIGERARERVLDENTPEPITDQLETFLTTVIRNTHQEG